MLRRTDNGLWTIPTGGLKKNETISACGIRECREETGIDIEITGMVGVFSDPRPRGRLPPPGRSHGGPPTLNVCLHARPTGGMLAPDPREATDVAWVHPDDLPALDVHPAIRVRLTHALTHPDTPHLG